MSKATELADALLAKLQKPTWDMIDEAAAKLRRLDSANKALLEALKDVMQILEPAKGDIVSAARAAIKQAEGE